MRPAPGGIQRGGDVARGGVLLDAVEDEDFQTGRAQRGGGALRMAGRPQAGVGDEQRPRAAEFARNLAEAGEGADAEDDARGRMVVQRGQRRGGRCRLARRRTVGWSRLPACGDPSGSGGYPGRLGGQSAPGRATRRGEITYCTTRRA